MKLIKLFSVITSKIASNDEIRKPVMVVDSTTKTAPTVLSTSSNESSTENQTQIVKDSRSQYIDDSSLHLLQRDIKLHSHTGTSELFNNTISNQTFVVLMLIIGLMSIAILFLIFTNRYFKELC